MFVNLRSKLTLQHQHGFSLLEVLITIVVLSIGLLGMAGLITAGMRSNNVAHLRSIATQQTLDIADRMRANLAGVRAGGYDNLDTSIPAGSDCTAAACTEVEMAVFDHARWNTANSRFLPNGQGAVLGTLATGFRITLMWREKEMDATAIDLSCPPGTAPGIRCFVTRFSP